MGNSQLLDMTWLLTCTALVFVMQAGFACLESGLVRSKNSINVIFKNVMDLCVAGLVFWAVGYAMMFGKDHLGIIGTTDLWFQTDNPFKAAYFLFQFTFCATAITIVSGAVAERMSFLKYLVIVAVMTCLIYPVFGHWAWGITAQEGSSGWLTTLGFVDFAGATVVHSTGAWIGLAAVLILGPRIGRFGDGKFPIRGHNLPMAGFGIILLWFGWLGFNGGSTLVLNGEVPNILINTCLAAAAGGLSGMVFSWIKYGYPRVVGSMSCVIAGLVSITACANVVTAPQAALIGAAGGVICYLTLKAFERWKIDDSVGAFACHGSTGIWGTLAVALFADLDKLATGLTRGEQVVAQLTGIGACAIWAFGVGGGLLWLFNKACPLRVSAEDEINGLNTAEHGTTTELFELMSDMKSHRQTGRFDIPITVEPNTEIGQIATQYNRVIATVHKKETELENKVTERTQELSEANERLENLASEDPLMKIGNRRAMEAELDRTHTASKRHNHFYSIVLYDVDFFKLYNDHYGHSDGDDALIAVANHLKKTVRTTDRVFRYGGEEILLLLPETPPEGALALAQRIVEGLAELRLPHCKNPYEVLTMSGGLGYFNPENSTDIGWKTVSNRADQALYQAKEGGRNQVAIEHGEQTPA